MLFTRILLAVLILLGIAGCLLTQFLDMTFLNTPSVYTELGAEDITDERRIELVTGLQDVGNLQFSTNVYAWWTALGTALAAALALMLSFREPKP